MKPSEALPTHRQAIPDIVARHSARSGRVFGSVAPGDDAEGSDIDVLVDSMPGATLLDHGALQIELEETHGLQVDLLTPGELPPKSRERVLREAVAVWASSTECSAWRTTSRNIIEAARLSRSYRLPMTREQFARHKKTQQAVMLNLMVIGEADRQDRKRVSRVPRSTHRNPLEGH